MLLITINQGFKKVKIWILSWEDLTYTGTMKSREIEHIRRNLHELVLYTNVSSEFLAILQGRGVLDQDEIDDLVMLYIKLLLPLIFG